MAKKQKFSADAWRKLGLEIKSRREGAGYEDTRDWVAAVGKVDRTILGLERGEQRGVSTLLAVERALDLPVGWCYDRLAEFDGRPPAKAHHGESKTA